MKLILATLALLTLTIPVLAAPTHHTTHHRHHHTQSARAVAPAAKSVQVWVNTKTGVYHYPGERWYGNTQEGKYISEAGAKAEGDRPTENGQ